MTELRMINGESAAKGVEQNAQSFLVYFVASNRRGQRCDVTGIMQRRI